MNEGTVSARLEPTRWARRSAADLRSNHMVRNSMWLLMNTGLQAVLGFVFWILAAHVFTTTAVGRATSLLSATTLIGYVALLGLNITMIRYLPSSGQRDTMITSGVLLVGSLGGLLALAYAVAAPAFASAAALLEHHALFVLVFVLMGVAAAINLVTDAVFIAFRRAKVNALVDGGIGGVTKLILIPVAAGSGAFGLYFASVGGFAAAAIASLILIWTLLGVRPRLRGTFAVMRPLLRFSGANYLGGVFTLAPALVVPLIVLARLGASAAAYYYVAFQLANLVFAGGYAVTQTFLAEGGHGEEELKILTRRAARVLAVLTVPACLVVAIGAPVLLGLFGPAYSRHGTDVLILLALAAIPVAALNWLVTILRLLKQLMGVAVSNGVYAVAICGLTWVLAPRGLSYVGVAWLGGALVGVIVAAVAVAFGSGVDSRHHDDPSRVASPAAHRRSRSGRGPGAPSGRRTQADRSERMPLRSTSGYVHPMAGAATDVDTVDGVAPPGLQDIELPATGEPGTGEPATRARRRRWPVVVAVAVVAIGLSLATPAGRHQWALSLIRQPTPYTVLSFENAARLPASLPEGAHLGLSFAVTNHEGRDIRYRYVVSSAAIGQDPAILKSGIIDVPSGIRQTKTVSVVPECERSPCVVEVSLPGSSESIDVQVALHHASG